MLLVSEFRNQSINLLFFLCQNVDQRAGQLSLPHIGITKTERNRTKTKTDEQINPVKGLEPRDQSYGQKQTKVEDNIF